MRLGKNMKNALEFVTKHEGWHTIGTDKATIHAVKKLQSLGLVELNYYRQFRASKEGVTIDKNKLYPTVGYWNASNAQTFPAPLPVPAHLSHIAGEA